MENKMRVIWGRDPQRDANCTHHASTRIRNLIVKEMLERAGVQFVDIRQPADVAVHFKRICSGLLASCHILDLSDNHFWMGPYVTQEADNVRLQLIEDVRYADRVVCPTSFLAGAAAIYSRNPPIVIPDPVDSLISHSRKSPVENRLLWHGNWGSKHHPEGGGMQDLLMPDVLDALDGFWGHLVVCSNSYERYTAIANKLPIPTRYVEWSPIALVDMLSTADLAIIPVTITPYTAAKSHNRVTTCIASGLPVITSFHPAYEEFGVCTDNWVEALNAPVPEPRPKSLLAPYTAEAVAQKWLDLLAGL